MKALAYEYCKPEKEGDSLFDITLKVSDFRGFGPPTFKLDQLHRNNLTLDALAAIVDLEGFTNFVNVPDPHVIVPDFVNRFVCWFLDRIRVHSCERQEDDHVHLFCALPLFVKFMGDGLLLLWKVDRREIEKAAERFGLDPTLNVQEEILNILAVLYNSCKDYHKSFKDSASFLAQHNSRFVNMPKVLRCGAAYGQVSALNDGQDFVGPCINLASRLQKTGNLTMCVAQKGIDPASSNGDFAPRLITRKYHVRGVGDTLLHVLKEEFESLEPAEAARFVVP